MKAEVTIKAPSATGKECFTQALEQLVKLFYGDAATIRGGFIRRTADAPVEGVSFDLDPRILPDISHQMNVVRCLKEASASPVLVVSMMDIPQEARREFIKAVQVNLNRFKFGDPYATGDFAASPAFGGPPSVLISKSMIETGSIKIGNLDRPVLRGICNMGHA